MPSFLKGFDILLQEQWPLFRASQELLVHEDRHDSNRSNALDSMYTYLRPGRDADLHTFKKRQVLLMKTWFFLKRAYFHKGPYF